MIEIEKFYLVTCKGGHVGRNFYYPITFPVKAENGREAAKIARTFARVKRDHSDAIKFVKKVDKKTYINQINLNHNEPYLNFSSRHEQNENFDLIKDKLIPDNHPYEIKKNVKSRKPNLYYQRKKYGNNYETY